MHDAYSSLTPGVKDGWTKKDAMHGQKIMNTLRDQFMSWKPTKEMLAAFKPIFAQEMTRVEAMKDGGKYKMMWNRWMNNKAGAEMFKMNQEMYKKGGVWDHFAGKDGIM
jgi:hypothetical protein